QGGGREGALSGSGPFRRSRAQRHEGGGRPPTRGRLTGGKSPGKTLGSRHLEPPRLRAGGDEGSEHRVRRGQRERYDHRSKERRVSYRYSWSRLGGFGEDPEQWPPRHSVQCPAAGGSPPIRVRPWRSLQATGGLSGLVAGRGFPVTGGGVSGGAALRTIGGRSPTGSSESRRS